MQLIAIVIFAAVIFFLCRSISRSVSVKTLPDKAYLLTLLAGALPCTLCIMIAELTFDRFILEKAATVGQEIFTAFARAALLEELMKYLFCRRAIKKHAPRTRAETMLLCGMIGAGYGLTEKLVYGGGVILIVNALLPLHIFFQFLMGSLLWDAAQVREADPKAARKKELLALVLPLLVHGSWDSLLSIAGGLLDSERFGVNLAGMLCMLALVAGGIVGELKVVKKTKALAATESAAMAPPETDTALGGEEPDGQA